MSTIDAAEVRRVYGVHVSFSLFGAPESPFSREKQTWLEECASDLATCHASQNGDDSPFAWVLARLALSPMTSGIDPDDAEGLHEAAIMSTADVLRREGHAITRCQTRRIVHSLHAN